jgi:segregation and condensation protein B
MAKRKKPTRAKNAEAQTAEAQAPIEPTAAAEVAPRAENDGAPVSAAPVSTEPSATADVAEGHAEPVSGTPVSIEPTEPFEAVPATPDPVPEAAGAAEADVWAEDRTGPVQVESPPAAEEAADGAAWVEPAEGAEAAASGETPDGEVPLAGDETVEDVPVVIDSTQMESIIESLLFASDKVLGLAELKRLLGERDGKKVTAAVDALLERRKGSGIEVVRLANGWQLRTNPEHARWVSKLLAGKPMRLSRAMMETLAIVAYRQPVTRPEVDDIRGVDCGPVLKTLLDRGLIRIIGKKEEVGRPLLYGTTPEFLRVFSLRELGDLPTLREYAELSSEQQARVDAEHGAAPGAGGETSGTDPSQAAAGEAAAAAAAGSTSAYNLNFVPRSQLPDEPEENDPLLDELDSATKGASKILGTVNEPEAEAAAEPEPEPATPPREPPSDS